MLIKLVKFIFNFILKKIWFFITIILLILILFFIAPNPRERTNLWIAMDSPLGPMKTENQLKISSLVTEIFSVPLLFNKYDLFFQNIAGKECDINIIIGINKNTDFFLIARKYFGDAYIDAGSDNMIVSYKIDEGDQIIVKSYPTDNLIKYATYVSYGDDTRDSGINKEGYLIKDLDCQEKFDNEGYKIVNFYTKINIINWLTGVIIIFLALIVIVSSFRNIWSNFKINNKRN